MLIPADGGFDVGRLLASIDLRDLSELHQVTPAALTLRHAPIADCARYDTEAQWRDLIENQGRRKIINGEVVEYDPPPPAPLVELTPAEKLAAASFTVAELKKLLGLK